MLTFIFNKICDKMKTQAQNLIKNNKVLVKITCFALVMTLSFVISFVTCGITFGFSVIYNGQNIGVVEDTSVFADAKDYIIENTEHQKVINNIDDASFRLTFALKENFLGEKQLANAIAENTDEITEASILYVNGKPMAFIKAQNAEKMLEDARCRYYIEGAENSAEFIDEIKIEKAYSYTPRVDTDENVKNIISNLKVKTVSKVSFEAPIAFSTKVVNTSSQYVGYSKVTTKGVQGLASKTELVETVNGTEASRETLKNEVLVQPVTQVVVKGTAINMASATEKAEAASKGFIMPLKSYVYVSAYWGDGRNHKAIDFAGHRGTALFAAKGGVVTCAGYRGNYGYLVEIDHGDGFKTRYAHCNALCVKVGQTVAQGQQIATMGNTGRSTGDHLHFEILKNGTQVNPAPYLPKFR